MNKITHQELTKEQEIEAQQIEDDLNDEANARRRSVKGAHECYLRGEIDGPELEEIVESNR